ncbi:hypothetical protein ACP2AV_01950 [Aliiroseovarius sp. PTFE2010]|uniref:hypothetical protein n=1 Tax=Aliiroseovarius sp. PTFE2010 TaxID=3417190 RepID=UPI003CE99B78
MTVPHTKGKGGLVSGIANRLSNALCPKTDRHGPVSQCLGSGYGHFCDGIDDAPRRAPEQSPVTLGDFGQVATARVNNLPAMVTGDITYVDGGHHVASLNRNI